MGTSINASYSTQDYGYSFTKSVTGAGDLYGALRGMLPWTVPYDEDGNTSVIRMEMLISSTLSVN